MTTSPWLLNLLNFIMNGPKKELGVKRVKKADSFSQNIQENVAPGSTLILGISGGADSMYLLTRCLEIQNFKIVVAHINHGLRGKDSNNDEKFVKNLCEKIGVPFYVQQLQLKKKSEEAGRDARYKFFEELRKKLKAQWILTAHHLNDNIETVLFNLVRGAHFNGLKGMRVSSPERHLLRPMLGITKKEILANLKSQNISYRLDNSNNNTDFSRNLLRKKILPLLEKINPNFEKTFKATINSLLQTNNYLEVQCKEWLQQNSANLGIDLEKFHQEDEGFQKLLLVHLYKTHHRSTKKLTTQHLQEVLNTIHLRQSGKKKEFGDKTFLELTRDQKNSQHYIRLTTRK